MHALLLALALLAAPQPAVVRCRAVDGLGVVLAEAEGLGGLACKRTLKAALEQRCTAGVTGFSWRYEVDGSRPAYLQLTCRQPK